MKTILQFIGLLLFQFSAVGQTARIVHLEHSLRWQTEDNFPKFLDDYVLERELTTEIDERLRQHLQCSEIIWPDHFDYRLISGFGKTKVKMPKPSDADFDIAIASSITRGTTNYKVLWNMNVIIRKNKEVILDKIVEHELDPYSVSIRFSKQPWMDENEFMNVFLFMFDECVGLIPNSPGPVSLGSSELIRQQVATHMPIEKEYTLAVAGAMMQQSNTSYKLLRDSLVLSDFSYKPGGLFDVDFNVSGNEILAGIFSQITGIDTYYTLKSKEKRTGAIYTHDGLKRKVRLDWLEESLKATLDDDELDSRILSPITGAYYDQDLLIAQFIFYKQIVRMNDISLHNLQFQMGDDDLSEALYTITGYYKGNKFEVVYREYDRLVMIRIQDQLDAILSLININPESSSHGGAKLSKNMGTITTSQKILSMPELKIEKAELYPLYTRAEVDDEAATEMGYFLLLLFFTMSNVG
ncbi:hypothetical protein SYJ56_04165 [Algoriphagus sp. D3-2-R+10]|uniref:hypothetical protein n=1 Tax=Algoriphagus aurantiacus TaxID=3103948 RepID=UPI002B367EB9|nr:hypothetical protein [Algoriphagus sp. D3-2-R+10]MEB2774486.1 hypothetical protein [Algoriphagus sp. D3-2-R+10]